MTPTDLHENSASTGATAACASGARAPAHAHVYTLLRQRILFGDYVPGQPLTIQGLVADTGAGMTPVREAIRRLTSEGALRMQGNRRLDLPVLTSADLDELSFVRNCLEPELAARATPHAGAEEIGVLRRIDAAINTAITRGDVPFYLKMNYQFHHTLYQLAHAPVLLETVDRLWLRFGPSLRVVCGRFGTMNLPDNHADILSALELGDVEAARRATSADVLQGMQQIAQATDSIDAK